MAKIIKNTTGSDIFILSAGVNVAASGQYIVKPEEYGRWAATSVINEVEPHLIAGDLVVNDGYNDLSAALVDGDRAAVSYLRHPDLAWNIRFLSDPDRINGFVSKDVQRAIEEAKTGTASVSPTTTTGVDTQVAYSQTLDDDTVYWFDARVAIRRTDGTTGGGHIQCVAQVRRESGGSATLIGNAFQAARRMTDIDADIAWQVSGNDVQLAVIGNEAVKVLKFQPTIEQEKVS